MWSVWQRKVTVHLGSESDERLQELAPAHVHAIDAHGRKEGAHLLLTILNIYLRNNSNKNQSNIKKIKIYVRTKDTQIQEQTQKVARNRH